MTSNFEGGVLDKMLVGGCDRGVTGDCGRDVVDELHVWGVAGDWSEMRE